MAPPSSTRAGLPASGQKRGRRSSDSSDDDFRNILNDMRDKRSRLSQADGTGDLDDDDEDEEEDNDKENVKPSELLTEADILDIQNPNLASCMRMWSLSSAGLAVAEDALAHWESITPSDQKDAVDVNQALPSMTADDDGAYPVAPEVRYFAPMHKVMEICVPIFIAGKIEGLTASAEMLAKRVASMEETIASLKASRAATVEDKSNLRAVVAGMFYSGMAPGYACGKEGQLGMSLVLENAAVDYFRSYPEMLGSNGADLVRPGNAEGEKAIRAEVKDKLDSLRGVTKQRLASSMGMFTDAKQTLPELARSLFTHYHVKVTPDRLYRLAWLRSMAFIHDVYVDNGKKTRTGEPKLEPRKDWWTKVEKKLARVMQAMNSEDERDRDEVLTMLQNCLKNDKKLYGHYEYDMSVGRDDNEQMFDEFINGSLATTET
ncbi:hypothetical protein V8E36_000316 [Tilletia maclaganii]